jgi:hypothetical protein
MERLLGILKDAPDAIAGDDAPEGPRTIEEIVVDLGWVRRDDGSGGREPGPPEFSLATGVSPRLTTKADRPKDTGSLRYLMNPDQPTTVSRQIEGIPTTEAEIYQVANDLRMRQKIQGKTKVKPPPVKDEVVCEDDAEAVLQNLISVGYIDEQEAKKIKTETSGGKPTGPQRRAHSEDKTPNPPRRQAAAPSLFGTRDRRRP